MKKLKSHFRFNRQERSGIFFLLAIIFLLQLSFFIIRSANFNEQIKGFGLNDGEQKRIDSLIAAASNANEKLPRSFNPNYISDFKGYELGMSLDEIDRLHSFRASGKYIKTTEQFQLITRVSDSLLIKISPYFRFPKAPVDYTNFKSASQKTVSAFTTKDLNMVTKEDLMKVSGIGEVLSSRIIKFRSALGGFMVDDQLFDVYGLDSLVARKVIGRYSVQQTPSVVPIRINLATAGELSQNVYISRTLARKIIQFRDSTGGINAIDELTKIQDFPSDKIDRIKLYLTL